MSTINSYRYLITAAVAFLVVLILYLCQPVLEFTPHGLVWPLQGVKINHNPSPNSIKIINQATFKTMRGKILGGMNVNMHDNTACSLSLSPTVAITPDNRKLMLISKDCQKSIYAKEEQLISKAKSLASTLDKADTMTYIIIPPNLSKGPDFAEWALQAVDADNKNILMRGVKHPGGK